jgi:hypothetical protein
MKTTKFFAALILSVIFSGILTVNAGNRPDDKVSALQAGSITHSVYVNWDENISLCNVYLVQITDEYGHLVAPVQRFYPNVKKYSFSERGGNRGKMRIASLVKATWPQHYVCPNELISVPVSKPGPFTIGSKYIFNLYTIKVVSME